MDRRCAMTERHRLPNRRLSETFELEAQGLKFTATVSRFDVAEVFLQNHKAASHAGINAQDAAVVCSIALQFGAPLDVIRKALMRDSRGNASGPLGVALDLVAEGDYEHPRITMKRAASAIADKYIRADGGEPERSDAEHDIDHSSRSNGSPRSILWITKLPAPKPLSV